MTSLYAIQTFNIHAPCKTFYIDIYAIYGTFNIHAPCQTFYIDIYAIQTLHRIGAFLLKSRL